MSRIFLISILIASCFNSLHAQETPPELKFSFGPHNAAPYILTKNGKVFSGVIWDIAHELTKALKAQPKFLNIPRKRQAKFLEKGETDILLISNPKWLNNANSLLWSKPLFQERDVIITLAEKHLTFNSKQDLYGLNIGAIRGYKYPLIDQDIKLHYIKRHDVKELDANFKKLLLERIDAFIDSSILVNYRLSKRKDTIKFQISPFIISSHQIYAAISPQSNIAPQDIIKALEKLKTSGAIEAILKKYN